LLETFAIVFLLLHEDLERASLVADAIHAVYLEVISPIEGSSAYHVLQLKLTGWFLVVFFTHALVNFSDLSPLLPVLIKKFLKFDEIRHLSEWV
jgi:hypothetical protein